MRFSDNICVTPRIIIQSTADRRSIKTRQSLQTHPNKKEVLAGYLVVASSHFRYFYKWSHTSNLFEVITTCLILPKQISPTWRWALLRISLLEHGEVCQCITGVSHGEQQQCWAMSDLWSLRALSGIEQWAVSAGGECLQMLSSSLCRQEATRWLIAMLIVCKLSL